MKKKQKPYWEMNTAELREATKEFDREFVGVPGKPLTAADRKLLARARRKGRPQVGQGAEKIRVSIERGLLSAADATAKRLRISRSELIAKGLRAVLKRAG
jgi:hypothetical protein